MDFLSGGEYQGTFGTRSCSTCAHGYDWDGDNTCLCRVGKGLGDQKLVEEGGKRIYSDCTAWAAQCTTISNPEPPAPDGPFVPVNPHNFQHSLRIADRRGSRIKVADGPAFQAFCATKGVDLVQTQAFAFTTGATKVAAIKDGLMEGLYFYSPGGEVCFRYRDHVADFRPLAPYGEDFHYDLIISYGSADRDSVLRLQETCERANLKTFIIDVAIDPSDPLWRVRYREALFFSRYLVVFLTDDYLAGSAEDKKGWGAGLEVFDGARLALEEWRGTFFYPMIVLVKDAERLANMDWTHKQPMLRELDAEAFAWLRQFAFPVALDRGYDWLTRFFHSLTNNAKGTLDEGFLACLQSEIESFNLHSFPRELVEEMGVEVPAGAIGPSGEFLSATVHLRHPTLTSYVLMLTSRGGTCRYVGVHEPGPDSFRPEAFDDPVKAIMQHLQGEGPKPSFQAASCSGQVHGRCLPTLPAMRLGDESVSAELNRTATRLLTRFGSRAASLYRLDDGQQLCQTALKADVAALNPQGNRIAVGTHSGLYLVDDGGKQLASSDSFEDGVNALAWPSDETCLAIGVFLTNNVRLVEPESLRVLVEIPSKALFAQAQSPLRTVFNLVFPPSGEMLAVASIAGLVLLNRAGSVLATLHSSCCYHSAFSPNGLLVVGSFYERKDGSAYGALRVFRTDTFREEARLQFPGPAMQALWLSDHVLLVRHRTRSNGPHRSVVWHLGRSGYNEVPSALSEGPASLAPDAGIVLFTDDTKLELRMVEELLRLVG